jgi:hypothetical protein
MKKKIKSVKPGMLFKDAQTMRAVQEHETLAENWWCEGVDEAVGLWAYSSQDILKQQLSAPKKTNEWELTEWNGTDKCWRKKFGLGYVSVGVGNLHLVVFSYGPNSDDSYSSTRWDYDRPTITEEDAMKMVDAGKGKKMIGRKPPPENWK